jgi:hypothetical protein
MTEITKWIKLFYKYHFTTKPYELPYVEDKFSIANLELDIDNYYQRIWTFSNIFNIQSIMEISYNKSKFPILEININPDADIKVFILSGIHGNEQASVQVIPLFLKYLENNLAKYKSISIRIITPLNPTGLKHFSRYNANGYDINRDFKNLITKEASIARKSCNDFVPDISISLHEGPQSNTFIFTNELVNNNLAHTLLDKLSKHNIVLAEKSYFGNKLKIPGLFAVTGMAKLGTKLQSLLFNIETFGTSQVKYNVPNITLETCWADSGTSRINIQLKFLVNLIGLLQSRTKIYRQ